MTGPRPGGVDALAALEQHEAALVSLRTELTDLETSPSFLLLTEETPGPETARRYGTAVREAAELWSLIDAADSLLGAARSHVATRRPGGVDGRELRRLLDDRWYSVTAGAGPRPYSAAELLGEIRRRFDAVRSAVADIDGLWVSVLPRIEAARVTLARLADEADQLGVPEPLVGRALALADDLADRLVSDPGSVNPRDGSNLDLQVAEAAKHVAGLRAKHDNLDHDLGSTEELLATLRVLLARAEAARAESSAKILDPAGLVRVPMAAILDGPDGLGAKLDRLFETAAQVDWSRKRNLLDAWLATARKLETQLVRAGEANRAPLDERDELRGRLRAYRAKMAATGRAEDLDLIEIVDRARHLLYTAPTDLEEAGAAIADLAARLRP